ncbi:hypothetical protein LCGC14_0901750, partial [marine sediment metagenome]
MLVELPNVVAGQLLTPATNQALAGISRVHGPGTFNALAHSVFPIVAVRDDST